MVILLSSIKVIYNPSCATDMVPRVTDMSYASDRYFGQYVNLANDVENIVLLWIWWSIKQQNIGIKSH